MPFVLDASIAACWALRDEDHPEARRALDELRYAHCFVPAIWRFEIRNILVTNERRMRITREQSTAYLHRISELRILEGNDQDEEETMHLARFHRLTFYDASYLELAKRRHLPLATLDSALVRAAQAESVGLFA